jgi:hypothetical protein
MLEYGLGDQMKNLGLTDEEIVTLRKVIDKEKAALTALVQKAIKPESTGLHHIRAQEAKAEFAALLPISLKLSFLDNKK